MKSGSTLKPYNLDTMGFNCGRSPRSSKLGMAGLRQSPRVTATMTSCLASAGSDKDSISGRSRRCRQRKPSSASPLYKKRNLDYTDYAHREAVNRLKFLLAESYTPGHSRKPSLCGSGGYRNHDDTDDTDAVSVVERPILSEISKYMPGSSAKPSGPYNFRKLPPYGAFKSPAPFKESPLVSKSNYGSVVPTLSITEAKNQPAPPPEILNFIEKQEGYIEQLERESRFCRDELNNLLGKVKDVISENETLTDHARAGIHRSGGNIGESSDSSDTTDFVPVSTKKKTPLSGPNIVFESRISELEAQLAQSAIDLKRCREENEANKRKLGEGGLESGNSDVYKRQLENLQRDKLNLEESVRKLQHTIDDLKQADASNFSRAQRTRDLADHSAFEKAQADLEIKRLKDELERQHDRVREIQHEMSKKVSEERSQAERRYNYQVDQLGGDLSSQWEVASRLQIEVERQKRMENDFRRDLAQRNAVIDDLRSELKAKTASLLSDMAQINAEKQSLEQEITTLRLQLEKAERQTKVESSRLNAEVVSLRQRLDRADSDLLHSRRENLRLVDQVSSLEKEITLGDLNRETRPSKELSKLMADMEAKHVSTVTDLEGMIHGQKQLMEKLTDECKQLTYKLDEATIKHKQEKDNLRQTNSDLMDRLRQLWSSYKQSVPSISPPDTTSASTPSRARWNRTNREALLKATRTDSTTGSESNFEEVSSNPSSHNNALKLNPTPSSGAHLLPSNNHPELNRTSHAQSHQKHAPIYRPPATVPPETTLAPQHRRPSTDRTDSQNSLESDHKRNRHGPSTSHRSSRSITPPNSPNNHHSRRKTITKPRSLSTMPAPPSMHPIPPTLNPISPRRNSTIPTPNSSTKSTTSSSTPNRSTTRTTAPLTTPPINSTTHKPDTTSNRTTSSTNSRSNNRNTKRTPATTSPNTSHNQQSVQQSQMAYSRVTQNQARAIELWGRNIQDPPALQPSSGTQPADRHFCRNSLPRSAVGSWGGNRPLTNAVRAQGDSDEGEPFDLVPSISISSPSLFDSSEDLSSAVTVHQQF